MECRHCEQLLAAHQRTSYGNFCPSVDLEAIDWDDREHPDLDGLDSFEPAWPKFVSAYEVTQAFGGHEEGGWWRSCYEPLESTRVDTIEERDEMLARLRKRYAVDEDGCYAHKDDPDHADYERERARGMSSCAGGYDVAVCCEQSFAAASVNPSGGYE